MDFDKVLLERHCTRKFLKKDVNFHKIITILESATLAPAAGNIFSVRVVIVNEPKILEQLVDASAGQQFLNEVNYVLVVCSDPRQVVSSYGKRAENYVAQQAGAAIENMFLETINLGLDTCWVGAFDETMVKRLLHIPDFIKVEALLPIGISLEKKIKKQHGERRKIDIKHIVYFNGYGLGAKRAKEWKDKKFEV
jgi:hypothetical protein